MELQMKQIKKMTEIKTRYDQNKNLFSNQFKVGMLKNDEDYTGKKKEEGVPQKMRKILEQRMKKFLKRILQFHPKVKNRNPIWWWMIQKQKEKGHPLFL